MTASPCFGQKRNVAAATGPLMPPSNSVPPSRWSRYRCRQPAERKMLSVRDERRLPGQDGPDAEAADVDMADQRPAVGDGGVHAKRHDRIDEGRLWRDADAGERHRHEALDAAAAQAAKNAHRHSALALIAPPRRERERVLRDLARGRHARGHHPRPGRGTVGEVYTSHVIVPPRQSRHEEGAVEILEHLGERVVERQGRRAGKGTKVARDAGTPAMTRDLPGRLLRCRS